jgi:hypothetical protein
MINYIKGDLFRYIHLVKREYPGINIVIPHIVNDIHAWGSGFVVPLGDKYPKARLDYLNNSDLKLGVTQIVQVEPTVGVSNMCAQKGIRPIGEEGKSPIRYWALCNCLKETDEYMSKLGNYIVMAPKLGSLRSGGKWEIISELIIETMVNAKIINVYEL